MTKLVSILFTVLLSISAQASSIGWLSTAPERLEDFKNTATAATYTFQSCDASVTYQAQGKSTWIAVYPYSLQAFVREASAVWIRKDFQPALRLFTVFGKVNELGTWKTVYLDYHTTPDHKKITKVEFTITETYRRVERQNIGTVIEPNYQDVAVDHVTVRKGVCQ